MGEGGRMVRTYHFCLSTAVSSGSATTCTCACEVNIYSPSVPWKGAGRKTRGGHRIGSLRHPPNEAQAHPEVEGPSANLEATGPEASH